MPHLNLAVLTTKHSESVEYPEIRLCILVLKIFSPLAPSTLKILFEHTSPESRTIAFLFEKKNVQAEHKDYMVKVL